MLDHPGQLVLGLMSGSSMDGIDLAMCRFSDTGSNITYELLEAETVPYPYYVREKLQDALYISPQDLHELDEELGIFFSDQINRFISRLGSRPTLIASHGHTVLHQPDKGITMQIGNGHVMAVRTGILVVNDFRLQDVSKGGQGAPLVPVGDKDLFGEYTFCLNLGGIANVSFDLHNRRIACDIAPCNMALNTIASWINMEFDNRGAMASQGEVNHDLLGRLNNIGYYRQQPPKSLGKEWFVRSFLPEIRKTQLTIEDALNTVNVHIAEQVAGFINRFAAKEASVLTTGGGVHNEYLVSLLRQRCRANMVIPGQQLVDFKEAIVFAYLGWLKINNRINVLSSVTGATSDTSAGVIYQPE